MTDLTHASFGNLLKQCGKKMKWYKTDSSKRGSCHNKQWSSFDRFHVVPHPAGLPRLASALERCRLLEVNRPVRHNANHDALWPLRQGFLGGNHEAYTNMANPVGCLPKNTLHPQKRTWTWNIHHFKRWISYWNMGIFQPAILVFWSVNQSPFFWQRTTRLKHMNRHAGPCLGLHWDQEVVRCNGQPGHFTKWAMKKGPLVICCPGWHFTYHSGAVKMMKNRSETENEETWKLKINPTFENIIWSKPQLRVPSPFVFQADLCQLLPHISINHTTTSKQGWTPLKYLKMGCMVYTAMFARKSQFRNLPTEKETMFSTLSNTTSLALKIGLPKRTVVSQPLDF